MPYLPAAHYGPGPGGPNTALHTVALVLGILAVVGMVIGFVPCLGWFNWINIPFGVVAMVVGIIGVTRPDPNKVGSIVGTACGGVAVVLGFVRLVIGAGVL